MYGLYMVGPQVERYYGKRRFALIYFVSGILGSLFSCVFMSEYTAIHGGGLGASGAIFGLLTSVGYFSYYYRATLQDTLKNSITPVIASNLLLSMMVAKISFSAHIGGLIGGLLISMAIGIGDKGRKSDQINGLIVLILMIAFMAYMIIGK
jgi:rhomboid protease GluP